MVCTQELNEVQEGLRGLLPKTEVHISLAHLLRQSLQFVGYKDEKRVYRELKKIYAVSSTAEALASLEAFKTRWSRKYPAIAQTWEAVWPRFEAIFAYPREIREIIYSSRVLEQIYTQLRRVVKNVRVFDSEEEAIQVFTLTLRGMAKRWSFPVRDWSGALNYFSLHQGERFNL